MGDNLNNKQWTYVLAIVVLVLVSILGYFETLTIEQVMSIFLLIIGALITGTVMYSRGKSQGFKEGRDTIG